MAVQDSTRQRAPPSNSLSTLRFHRLMASATLPFCAEGVERQHEAARRTRAQADGIGHAAVLRTAQGGGRSRQHTVPGQGRSGFTRRLHIALVAAAGSPGAQACSQGAKAGLCAQQAGLMGLRASREGAAPHLHAQEGTDGEQPLAQAALRHPDLLPGEGGAWGGCTVKRVVSQQPFDEYRWALQQAVCRSCAPTYAGGPACCPGALRFPPSRQEKACQSVPRTLRRQSSSGARSGMLAGRRTTSSRRCPSSTSITALQNQKHWIQTTHMCPQHVVSPTCAHTTTPKSICPA